MRKRIAGFLVVVLLLASVPVLGGCGGSSKVTLNVFNWGEYMDETLHEKI